ncbi:enoyl-CoA hydratase [Endozoicomonas sp. G2_2]|uniref:enoyl-CoA hydratase n=1 Tax=Endozoicomonas sp. G2_2 TaxID=2821092 RepID=UPI001ADB87FA|nr:enoyl-CoA hydratase [Endozoicomonas sp. G2_2]MBO9470741.1 enoyl-CoA hydratase [Endozoicomonas sp. G2_2]
MPPVERMDRTAVLTFDNPPAHVFTASILRDFAARLDALEADPDVTALVVTGAGDRFFCAGDDLNMYVGVNPAEARELTRLLAAVITRLRAFSGVTIAAINGWCLGGGLECALACDIRIGEAHAQFGLPEGRVGLLPCGGGTQMLARQVGDGWAKRLILCGETVDADTALRIGLIEETVSAGQARDAALSLAEKAARQSPVALAESKTLVHSNRAGDLETGLARERDAFGDLFAGRDAAEGVAAFLEKREPQWNHNRSRNER